ncbi:aminoacetone oxidase family FAD-binding enzyme [Helicobacter turcicus]|uniref:Aminoacetone oxidase family FAD-binding enzyme n=1 Tax=Helicobacter turcicus TaxID=2867412 RepID=A0ABS7JN53_9HELI|nr:aminoacetone oxidase family FAD-binding enzyme [Helicobacter turcicus]MBX7490833.1 aminoacetone oxidase family FAD-binding enzyme [Helicobacter turcicus]MBX7545558.1 aminoacetone oxidase family FAD-binding enzyme [Helicobacter turcicus]
MQKVAIIGGGASGIFCAVLLSLHNIPVVLFEKNKILGKKLLATGNGRCNIHNIHTDSTHFQSASFRQKDLQHILQNYPFIAFAKTCQNLGLLLESKEDGRVYPLANSAKSILEIFTHTLNTNPNLQIALNTEITAITPKDSSFLLQSQNNSTCFDILILACGSQAAPKLGGSDKGEKFAQNLGLKLYPSYPSLVPIRLDSTLISSLSGIKIKAKLTLKKNEQILAETLDDVLFTDYGISGFGVLDISSFMQTQKNFTLFLDFLPNLTSKTLENALQNTLKHQPKISIETLLCGFLHPKIAKAFVTHLHPNPNNTKHLKQFIFTLKNFLCENPRLKDFESAEVCGGGVSGKEIHPNTMESKNYKNLYIIGEMLDIVGNRGGYNLAFAWASAHACAKAVLSQIK